MGNIFSPPERANPIQPPNGRVLECERCNKTPAAVGFKCSWCFEYPELDKKGKLRSAATSVAPIYASIVDVAAHVCQSDPCLADGEDVVAVGLCTWCWKIDAERKL